MVVGAASFPECLGQKGNVVLVQLRKCSISGAQVYQASVALGGKIKMIHTPVQDLQLVTEGSKIVDMMPFRQSFAGFDKELPAIRTALAQGPLAEQLELATSGKLLESATVHAGQLELKRCRRKCHGRKPSF